MAEPSPFAILPVDSCAFRAISLFAISACTVPSSCKPSTFASEPLSIAMPPASPMLAGDWDVASMTGRIPYPYSETRRYHWINGVEAMRKGIRYRAQMRS